MAHAQALTTDETEVSQQIVLVAIPAYNEDRFIGSVVLKLRSAGYEVLVVDDGSTDETAAVAEAAGAQVVRHEQNQGKTAAVCTVFMQARSQGVDALVLMDGDSQHDPSEVDRVLAPILDGQADMVVGSRFAGLDSSIPRWRIAGQHALTVATNIGSGLHLSDTESGFRAFSRRALEGMRFRGTAFSVEPEMQFEAQTLGLRVVEVPIRVHYELAIKRNPIWQGVRTMDAVLRLVSQHRPLIFFTVPGIFVVLLGLALGIHVVRVYEASLQLAIGTALITVLLCVVGVVAVMMGIVLHTLRSMFMELLRRL